jgi:hypothetical protein
VRTAAALPHPSRDSANSSAQPATLAEPAPRPHRPESSHTALSPHTSSPEPHTKGPHSPLAS